MECGRECKRYLERVAKKKTRCVEKPETCVYENCKGGGSIQYHGWYRRKGTGIPCGEGDVGVAGPIWIRRFKCCTCGRTFSWRPWFLAFGRQFMAAAYEAILEPKSRDTGDWWTPSTAARQKLRRQLRHVSEKVIRRLEAYCPVQPSRGFDTATVLLSLAETARQHPEQPRYSSHILFLTLACTRSASWYKPTAT